MPFIEMKVTGLTIDPFTSMPIIILKDMEDKQALPIWIGLIEASAIATELEKIQLSRPMTHDLLKNILDSFGLVVEKVSITELRDNTFFAKIYVKKDDKEVELDARPSDAIAVALRTKSKILVEQTVVDKSRKIDLGTDDSEQKKRKWAEILESLSPEDFGKYKM
ncbi:MAG: hypothetical protein COV46_05400 [Deltaproteobacteria bacterium CG11_big_fil_rev_8_21_14_0_20_49_13]|nr:MAG: hypothetical protein COV46_05400 [Deltaproteobacteria bacterium CG11_big_fil_rev_8_21_14_0_20_49_13]